MQQPFRDIKEKFNNKFGNLAGRVVGGASWAVAGTVASKILVFIATIIVARILTKEVYGELGIIRSTIQLFVGLSSFGIGATATKYISQYRNTDPHKTIKMYLIANIFVFVMAIVASTVLLCGADLLAERRLNRPELATEIRIAAVILFFTLLNGAQTGTLSGFEDFRRIALCNLVMGISEIILLCSGAYFFGLKGAVIGFGLTYCIAWIYNSYHIRSHLTGFEIPILEEFKKIVLADFRPLVTFSLPVAATSWIQMIMYWWQKTAVVNVNGFANLANYDVAEQWKSQLSFIPMILATVVLPVLSNLNDDKNSRREVIRLNFKLNVIITSVCALIIALSSKYLLMLYGPEYTNAIPLYFLSFCAVTDAISQMTGTIFMSSDKAYLGIITSLIWVISLVVLFNVLSGYGFPLENVLAASYFSASFLQMFFALGIIKLRKLY